MSTEPTNAVGLQPDEPSAVLARPRWTTLRALIELARPRQWVKNVLVFAAPGTAGILVERDPLLSASGAFVAFCLAGAGAYCINDARDHHADRLHPGKSIRPVAAGRLTVETASKAGVALSAAGLLLALLVGGLPLLGVLGAYVALAVLYSFWLKHVAVADVLALAAFFLIRIVAGAVATDAGISGWFILVTCSGAVSVAGLKRRSESLTLGSAGPAARPTLAAYSPAVLMSVSLVASAIAAAAYTVWVLRRAPAGSAPWLELTILPFVAAMIRYIVVSRRDPRSAPEDIVVGDRPLLLMGAAWIVLLTLGIAAPPS